MRVTRAVPRTPRAASASLPLAVIVITAAFLFPFYWIAQQSLQSVDEYNLGKPTFWPHHVTFDNYRQIFSATDGLVAALRNSVLVSSVVTAVTLACCCLAAYGLNRLVGRGRNTILALVLMAGFFPLWAMIGPLFLAFRQAHLLNTLPAVMLADLVYTVPLGTWLLTSLFEQLPWELEEAALIDGCTRLGALRRVILPIAMPSLVTVGILSFVLSWQDFAFSLAFLQTPDKYTAPLATVFLGQNKYQVFLNRTDAAVVVITLPIALVVFLAQRRIVRGLTTGALK
jgi:ABC-type glycerol-3-phosphate transport system permease component